MKHQSILTLSLLLVFTFNLAVSQEQVPAKKSWVGLYWATGITYDSGKASNSYTKNKYENSIELGVYYKTDLSNKKYSLKFEYTARYFNRHIIVTNGVPGLVNQINQGFNVKLGKPFLNSENFNLLFLVGPGIYTIHQKRIADPAFSDQRPISDGFAPYWGSSVELEIIGCISMQRGRTGVSTRIFVQPPFAFAAKEEIPKFFHQGVSLAWFVEF